MLLLLILIPNFLRTVPCTSYWPDPGFPLPISWRWLELSHWSSDFQVMCTRCQQTDSEDGCMAKGGGWVLLCLMNRGNRWRKKKLIVEASVSLPALFCKAGTQYHHSAFSRQGEGCSSLRSNDSRTRPENDPIRAGWRPYEPNSWTSNASIASMHIHRRLLICLRFPSFLAIILQIENSLCLRLLTHSVAYRDDTWLSNRVHNNWRATTMC